MADASRTSAARRLRTICTLQRYAADAALTDARASEAAAADRVDDRRARTAHAVEAWSAGVGQRAFDPDGTARLTAVVGMASAAEAGALADLDAARAGRSEAHDRWQTAEARRQAADRIFDQARRTASRRRDERAETAAADAIAWRWSRA